MAAADLAPLPIALLRLVVLPDELLAFGHGDGRGLPQRERVDRAGGPAPAVRAMAVASADRVTRHDELDRTTEALPRERLLVLVHDTPWSCSVPLSAHATRWVEQAPREFAQRERAPHVSGTSPPAETQPAGVTCERRPDRLPPPPATACGRRRRQRDERICSGNAGP